MSVDQTSKFERDEQVAALIGALVGGVLAGVFMDIVGGADAMVTFSWLIGSTDPSQGWAVWMALAVGFGLYFGGAMARNVNKFTNTVIMVSRKSELTQKILVPLLHRSALGLTAGSMGLIYGQILGFGFYAYITPIIAQIHGIPADFVQANFVVIFGYIIYAQTLGTVYGQLLEAHWFHPSRNADEQNAAFLGAIVGGPAGAGVLSVLGGQDALVAVGNLAGGSSVRFGAAVYMALAVVFGIAFAPILARTINDFTNAVIMFSRRSKATQKILVPLITRAALTVTAGSMGLVYGLGIGLVWTVAAAAGLPLPALGLAGIVSFTVYGYVLGNVYGLMIEKVGMAGPLFSEEQVAGLKAAPIAGLLSGVVIFLLVLTGVVPGDDPLLQAVGLWRGFAVWLGLSVALGLVFVAYVSRTINDFTNTVIMFSRRSKLTQKILVPLITRAALTTTASSMGLGFGLGVGVLFYLVALFGPIPATTPLVILAFVLYGQALGVNYGLQLEDVDFSLPSAGPPEPEPAAEDDPLAGKQGFAAWRVQRPFAGSTMLILAGFIIGAIPIRIQQTFAGTTGASIGIAFAAMVAACGLFALLKPELSTLVGVTGVAMSILSLIGAFGGLVIGMLVGIVGGCLCIAWQDPNRDEEAAGDSRFKWIGEGDQQW